MSLHPSFVGNNEFCPIAIITFPCLLQAPNLMLNSDARHVHFQTSLSNKNLLFNIYNHGSRLSLLFILIDTLSSLSFWVLDLQPSWCMFLIIDHESSPHSCLFSDSHHVSDMSFLLYDPLNSCLRTSIKFLRRKSRQITTRVWHLCDMFDNW